MSEGKDMKDDGTRRIVSSEIALSNSALFRPKVICADRHICCTPSPKGGNFHLSHPVRMDKSSNVWY